MTNKSIELSTTFCHCDCDYCTAMIEHCNVKPDCNVFPQIQGSKKINVCHTCGSQECLELMGGC